MYMYLGWLLSIAGNLFAITSDYRPSDVTASAHYMKHQYVFLHVSQHRRSLLPLCTPGIISICDA